MLTPAMQILHSACMVTLFLWSCVGVLSDTQGFLALKASSGYAKGRSRTK